MSLKFKIEQFTKPDFKLYFKLVGNEKVMEMITERALPWEEAQLDFIRLIENNELDSRFGSFKIVDASSGDFFGLAKLEIEDTNSSTAELGYMILPEYWGKGLGSSVAKQLIEVARQHKNLQSLYAIIDPKNTASRKILIKGGFTSKEFKDFDGLPGEILELQLM